MDEATLNAALAGFARGMADFWPADISTGEPTSDILTRAERLVRGAEEKPGTSAALHSVFGSLMLPGKPKPTNSQVLPFELLTIREDTLFPVPSAKGDLGKLRGDFQRVVRAVKDLGPQVLLETALDAAMRFAWCVPAVGYGEQCDVSRYDHARSTAAIAACLSRGQDFALIGCGLDGIQSFIYTLASDGAAKSLRARSFYLQLLTEAIARDVLTRLGLPITNALYIGGGGFQLLALGQSVDALAEIEADIQRRLLIAHRAALGIVIKAQRFDAAQFDQFGLVRDALGQTINAAKRRPFAAVPAELLAQYIGAPLGTGGDQTSFCRVTGEELPPSRRATGDDEQVKSEFVESLERLGLTLREATHIAMTAVRATDVSRVRDWHTALRMFGMQVEVLRPGDQPVLAGDGLVELARLTPDAPSGEAALRTALGQRSIVTFYYPFARLTPRHATENRPLMFDELAACSAGVQRWAVLRMDVDNLGLLFRNGFGAHPSLARAAGLSFALRLFFEGWLPALAGEYPNLNERLYIQYAGGDDVFVVGAWDAVADYALRIRDSFGAYTVQNPSLTLSGGITLAEAKFPLYQAARMAGEAEEAAKHYTHGDKAKDAITFLEQTLSWEDYAQAYQQALDLAGWCGSGIASRSLLQALQQLHAQSSEEHQRRARNHEPKRQYTRATWLAAYQLTRVAESLAHKPQAGSAREAVKNLQAQLMEPNAHTNVIALSARWAQFLI